jgi:hypothetical protein
LNSIDSPEQSGFQRRLQQLGDRMHRYRDWFVDQPNNHLSTTMVIGVALVSVVYVVLRLVLWMVAGLLDWLFIEDTPPPPEPSGPLETALSQLSDYVGGIALHWSAQHPVGDTDPALVLVLWLIVGAVLLLFTRTLPGAVVMTCWAAASVWVVAMATPGGNPVPAALVAATIALAWCAWWLISSLVAQIFR